PWSVLGSGVLTGKYNQGDTTGRAKLWGDIPERDLTIAQAVVTMANEIGCTPSQVAMSWVRQQPGVIVPLIGARTLAQLEDNLGCLNVTLTGEQLAALNEVSRFELGFPHEFINSPQIRDLLSGGTHDKIDNHHFN
nr:aldo/keto reductase [Anaerolineae bacterium]